MVGRHGDLETTKGPGRRRPAGEDRRHRRDLAGAQPAGVRRRVATQQRGLVEHGADEGRSRSRDGAVRGEQEWLAGADPLVQSAPQRIEPRPVRRLGRGPEKHDRFSGCLRQPVVRGLGPRGRRGADPGPWWPGWPGPRRSRAPDGHVRRSRRRSPRGRRRDARGRGSGSSPRCCRAPRRQEARRIPVRRMSAVARVRLRRPTRQWTGEWTRERTPPSPGHGAGLPS